MVDEALIVFERELFGEQINTGEYFLFFHLKKLRVTLHIIKIPKSKVQTTNQTEYKQFGCENDIDPVANIYDDKSNSQ